MSKLDDIVNQYAFYQEQEFNKSTIKGEFKLLMLELIGGNYNSTTFGNVEILIDIANKEKDKLRQKVNEL